jgi:hypothetical protein
MLNQQKTEINKDYMTLCEVASDCSVPLEDLRYLGEEGKLTICLRRIPVNVAIEDFLNKKPYTENPQKQRELLKIMDEPQPLHQTDIYRIFANRESKIEITRLKTQPFMKLVKIISPGIMVGFDDLVITREEKERFEFLYLRKSAEDSISPLVIVSPDFRNFILYGREYFFGEKAARVIKYLYKQYVLGDPWVHSKRLLDISDSHSWRIHNLFSHNPEWRNVIRSGGNGYYMLNIPTKNPSPANAENTINSRHCLMS